MLDTKYQKKFYDEIVKNQKKKILQINFTFAYGTDASFYRINSKNCYKADNAKEVPRYY